MQMKKKFDAKTKYHCLMNVARKRRPIRGWEAAADIWKDYQISRLRI